MTSALRLAVAALILFLLTRSAKLAWRNRGIALTVWRRIRLHHVAGSLLLLVVVLGVAVALMTLVPVTGYGLGHLVGLTGNAVFAPVEEAASRSAAVAGPQAQWVSTLVTAGTAAFLAALLVLFPWLAYVEEQVFREGLETASPARRIWAALRFGLIHLVMLVPVAAALAIAVAGFWYGTVYRRAFSLASDGASAAVADEAVVPFARSEAVLASTVWHTTLNSLIVLLVLAGVLTGWL